MQRRAAVSPPRSLIGLLLALSGACAAARPTAAPPPGAPPGPAAAAPVVDTSLVPLCLRVLADDGTVREELARHPVVARMAEGMRPQVIWTPAEYAAAAFAPAPAAGAAGAPALASGSDGARFSWARLRASAAHVQAFVAAVERDPGALVAAAEAEATRLLGTPPAGDPVTLRWSAAEPGTPTSSSTAAPSCTSTWAGWPMRRSSAPCPTSRTCWPTSCGTAPSTTTRRRAG
jgi:hypothetical protein